MIIGLVIFGLAMVSFIIQIVVLLKGEEDWDWNDDSNDSGE